MVPKSEPPKKLIYRLWWDYLKRSENYKELCEWWYGLTEKDCRALPPKKFRAIGAEAWNPEFEFKVKGKPCICRGPKGEGLSIWLEDFRFFGNVFTDSFEEWWRGAEKILSKINIADLAEDPKRNIGEEIRSIISEFKRQHSREPSLKELTSFSTEVWNKRSDLAYLKIPLLGHKSNLKMILRELRKILGIKRKNSIAKMLEEEGADMTWTPWLYPNKSIFYPQVKRYGEIYDWVTKLQKKGKNWDYIFSEYHREIEKKIVNEDLSEEEGDKLEDGKESKDRLLYQDVRFAKNIIKWAEVGIFPGNYKVDIGRFPR